MPQPSDDVSPKTRRAGLSAAVLVGLALFAAVIAASLYYVLSADTSGPIAQGGENLVSESTAAENYDAVTDEAPIVSSDYETPG